jgi:glycosyltransferase involved in cell wall biosynthesis
MNSLVLTMIVRDEARAIERCLASARPWVDRMLVLDTGSVDATAALARAAGAEVHRFDWVDDFSAARNHALALADADWSLVLDADEWIADGGAAIAALRGVAPEFAGLLRVDSEFDSGAEVAVAPSWLARMLPRGSRFVGRVHEQGAPGLARRRLAVRVGHDGYRNARRPAKQGRNDRLLRLALAAAPADPYLHYQLGKDLEQADRFDAALPHYERAHAAVADASAWRHDLVLRLIHVLKRGRHWARAIALAEAEMPRWGDSPGYYFTLGDLLLDWAVAEPARAGELLPMIESSWLQCLALGERPELEGSIQGCGSFLAAKNLAAFHTSLGDAAKGAHYRGLEAELRRSAPR